MLIDQKIIIVSVNDISRESNFIKTVIEGVAPSTFDALSVYQKKDKILLWGINEKIKAPFIHIKQNDLVFFYHKQRIVCICEVDSTLVNRSLSISLWGTFQKYTQTNYWSNILIFKKSSLVDISFKEIIELGHYKPGFKIRRMIPVNETFSINILKKYKSISDFIQLHLIEKQVTV